MLGILNKLSFILERKNNKRTILGAIVLAGLAILADQWSKMYALNHLPKMHEITHYAKPQLVQFRMVLNPGISFGLFADLEGWMLLSFISIFFLGVIVYLSYSAVKENSAALMFAAALVGAGGISNLLDRFLYNAVVDFIDVGIGIYRFPTFNLADAFIFCGGACYLLWSLCVTKGKN